MYGMYQLVLIYKLSTFNYEMSRTLIRIMNLYTHICTHMGTHTHAHTLQTKKRKQKMIINRNKTVIFLLNVEVGIIFN